MRIEARWCGAVLAFAAAATAQLAAAEQTLEACAERLVSQAPCPKGVCCVVRCGEGELAAQPGGQALDEQPHAHQLAAAEGVAEREEGACRAQPRDDVVRAAQQHAEFAHAGLRQHHRGNAGEAHRRERAARGVQAVEEPPQTTCGKR